jgi:cell division transport system permease protein
VKFFNRLRYFCADAWDEWRHSLAVNILALSTLAVALFLAGLVMLIIGNVDQRIQALRGDVRVEVYLHEGHDPAARQALIDDFNTLDGVARVEFVDKDEALERYSECAAGVADLVPELETNPLPASIEVYLESGQAGSDVATTVVAHARGVGIVEQVRFSEDWLRRLEAMLDVARAGGGGLIALVLAAVVFMMAAVLRLAVYARREEIAIMQLVGATTSFIRGPFLVTGAVHGLVASVAALVLVEGVRRAVVGWLGSDSTILLDLLTAHALALPLSVLLVVVGLLVSLTGSWFAVRQTV